MLLTRTPPKTGGGAHPPAPALPSESRLDGGWQASVLPGSPHTLARPHPGAGTQELGLDAEDPVVSRGLRGARWEGKPLGGEEGSWHQPQEPGIAPGVGASPAPPGSQEVAKAARPKQPRWAHSPLPAAQGQARRSPSGRALLEELNIERGDTVARQKQAGGAVNRTMLFVVT